MTNNTLFVYDESILFNPIIHLICLLLYTRDNSRYGCLWQVFCKENFYGEQCRTSCVPVLTKYTCDPTSGARRCLGNFIPPTCDSGQVAFSSSPAIFVCVLLFVWEESVGPVFYLSCLLILWNFFKEKKNPCLNYLLKKIAHLCILNLF